MKKKFQFFFGLKCTRERKRKRKIKETIEGEKKLTEYLKKITKIRINYMVKNTSEKSLKIEKSKYIQKRSV